MTHAQLLELEEEAFRQRGAGNLRVANWLFELHALKAQTSTATCPVCDLQYDKFYRAPAVRCPRCNT